MNNNFTKWEDLRKQLNITPEQECQIQLEMDIINAIIEARKSNNLTQRDLAKKSGIKQPVIARIEKNINSPQISTLIKLLYPLGYTLRVLPLDNSKEIKI